MRKILLAFLILLALIAIATVAVFAFTDILSHPVIRSSGKIVKEAILIFVWA